jgi:hypothetical protein
MSTLDFTRFRKSKPNYYRLKVVRFERFRELRTKLLPHEPQVRKWRYQYSFCIGLVSIISLQDVVPLMYCLVLLGDSVGGQDNSTGS